MIQRRGEEQVGRSKEHKQMLFTIYIGPRPDELQRLETNKAVLAILSIDEHIKKGHQVLTSIVKKTLTWEHAVYLEKDKEKRSDQRCHVLGHTPPIDGKNTHAYQLSDPVMFSCPLG
ncbi:hypothetical protein J6590_064884 [Homalodisca vitripennis]|nr:hypothetical protein J6590_064884 [Homalodisca vitripennis]